MNKFSKTLLMLSLASCVFCSCTESSEKKPETSSSKPAVSQKMRDITAAELVSEMKIGWSLGNTMESVMGKKGLGVDEYEKGWGNPITSEDIIKNISESGFNVLRVPVSWGEHLSDDGTYTIDEQWLDRVNEIVDYGINSGMFVILNTHHEEWLFPDEAHFESNKEQLTRLWTQIGNRFEGYGESLIFEGLNEPRKRDTVYEWNGGDEEGQQVVNKLNAAFVETIRGLGGNNPGRCLMIPTYAASPIEKTFAAMTVPENDDKIIVSVHAYIPYNFALADKSQGVSEWSSSDKSCTAEIDTLMDNLKAYFLDKNIPVIIGEMGCVNRDNTEARVDWTKYYVGKAKEYGIPCVWWDNGAYAGSEPFGIYSRNSGRWFFSDIGKALVETAG
ncbi:MAG: glycoside hydrolase family 5 protein [Ruminococcus sp.]|nr:glycoside hydrolase family 5 protein [Ruminococcus sp.]